MRTNNPTTNERPLTFPEGGVWSLRHTPQPRSASNTNRHAMPMPGDLTTDRVLDEMQQGLDEIASDLDELTGLLDDVLFRFPGSNSMAGRNAAEPNSDWPPSAA